MKLAPLRPFLHPRLLAALPALMLAAGLQASPASEAAPLAAVAAPLDIKFSQFFRQPIGDRGLVLSDALRAADGREVRLVGYMVAQEQPQPGRFWLTPRPVRMSEHADGEADDLPPATVTVRLDPSQQDRLIPHQDGLLVLTGRLRVGRVEDETGRVSWVRLELSPDALAAQPGAPAAAHGHAYAAPTPAPATGIAPTPAPAALPPTH
ncbi:hypothetical protein [Roseateles terrae]|uniref:Uncharacterized protein n=1 Tax=Roseateles terrae TaxID=431060 RepID=A0ABR6GYQ6_9BURK|nr:hypothetical protein [Roseateles terrae]MBB3197252.1 hypothetical protein [Roseateles terrae]OWQ83685.1 hypothetical protein CDN98_21825 [Roseateles terrae]